MSNFQARFDEASAEARRLVVNHGNAIRAIIPRFYGTDFDRLIKSISKLLEKVDKGNVDHSEYLAHSSGNVAEYVIQVIQGVPNSLQSGADHFVQTTLPTILLCEERLLKAVGHYFFQVREVKDRQVKEIQKLAEEAIEFRQEAFQAKKSVEEIQGNSQKLHSALEQMQVEAKAAASKISETRNLVSKLASGDGRGKSLEALKRVAEAKVETIEGVLSDAESASEKASAASDKLDQALASLTRCARK